VNRKIIHSDAKQGSLKYWQIFQTAGEYPYFHLDVMAILSFQPANSLHMLL
jgi:hypothetical protein